MTFRSLQCCFTKAALKDKNYELAIKYADEILAQNYIFPDAHLVKNRAYESLGQSDKALYHRYVLNGLIESMLQSGDGKSPESAFVVVLIDEESVILNVLNVKQGEQASTDIDGHSYDIIDGVNLTTGNSIKVYFNIDIPFGVLIKSLQP